MARPLSLRAKVLGRLNEPRAKDLLPKPIDCHADDVKG